MQFTLLLALESFFQVVFDEERANHHLDSTP
jgi:hypothetical protein